MSISKDGLSSVRFGKEMLEEEFRLARDTVHLNHGADSAVPRRVQSVLEDIRREAEDLPDLWFRDTALSRWMESRDCLAEFVKAKPENLVLIENVTTAINTVLKSVLLKPGDAVLGSNLTHQAVINTFSKIAERIKDFRIHYVHISFPIESEEEIIDLYDQCLTEHKNIKLVVIDHVTSHSALMFPVKRMAEVVHRHNALLLVDGAHAIGNVPMDLKNLGVDFYTGSLHKWCFCPRISSFLWVDPKHQSWLSPLVTSNSHGEGFTKEFYKQGTRDLASSICSKAAIQFLQEIGGQEKILTYCQNVLKEAVEKLENLWGTQHLQIPESMQAPCMILVRLPNLGIEPTSDTAEEQSYENVFHRNLAMRVMCIQGHLYARLCCSVYNAPQDYEIVGQIFKELSENIAS